MRNSKDWALAQRYLESHGRKSGENGNLETWEQELLDWDSARPVATMPSPKAIKLLRDWARANS